MTRLELTGCLNIKGYRGLRGWAIERGHSYNTIASAVSRHLGREGAPRGKTRVVLHELEATIERKLYTRLNSRSTSDAGLGGMA